jgi:hypothetical protein
MCMWLSDLGLSAALIITRMTCSDMQIVAFELPPHSKKSDKASWTKDQATSRSLDKQIDAEAARKIMLRNEFELAITCLRYQYLCCHSERSSKHCG